MIYLLDTNVLIALCDRAHPHSVFAKRFFETALTNNGWATCPIVENGFLRIFGAQRYRGGAGSTQAARMILEGVISSPGHQFWPDDLSLADHLMFPALPSSQDLTDIYLLSLAVKHGARFATFDSKIDPAFIPGGAAAYHVIQTA